MSKLLNIYNIMTEIKTEVPIRKKRIATGYNKKRYTIKQVYHTNKDTLVKLLKIGSKTNRSYNAIMNELAENFVSRNEKLIL